MVVRDIPSGIPSTSRRGFFLTRGRRGKEETSFLECTALYVVDHHVWSFGRVELRLLTRWLPHPAFPLPSDRAVRPTPQSIFRETRTVDWDGRDRGVTR